MNLAAVDPQPTTGTDPFSPEFELGGNGKFHAVRIFAMDVEIDWRVIDFGLGSLPTNGFDSQGAAAVGVDRPMGNVVVMADPIHQRATAIGPIASPPAMMAGPHVGQLGSGTAPHFVIEFSRWSGDRSVSLGHVVPRRQSYLDTLDCPQMTIADQLDGLPKQ